MMGHRNILVRAITVLLLLASWPVAVAAQIADADIRAVTDVIRNHGVGGVALDLVGNIYVADFGETVFKITPAGERTVFATGLYGASGNAIDRRGNLLQSSFYGDFVTIIDRSGRAAPLATTGLSGPVGIAVAKDSGDVFVANCRGNSISRISPDGKVSEFAKSSFFKCPNGIALDDRGDLYVVNYRDNRMLRVDLHGQVTQFATVSRKGLGHICFKGGRFYVTGYISHAVYEVSRSGSVRRLVGNGEAGLLDGSGERARLSTPNGIACDPYLPRLFINELLDEDNVFPKRMIVRQITLHDR
jgi:sugar lactone lactonase YvrE